MSIETEKIGIEARFAGWSVTPIKWPNLPFQQPSSAWIAVYIQNGESRALDLDSVLMSHRGVVIVQIFDRENNGEAYVWTLAKQVQQLFVGVNNELLLSDAEQVHFFTPSVSALSITNGWVQRNVTIPFEREEG